MRTWAPPSLWAVVALILAGCGGGAASAASDATLTSCASRWNSERAAASGAHAYGDHRAQEALVTTLEHEGAEACAVIFAVPESDSEAGTVGEVATLRGWVPMQIVGGDPRALQRRAGAEANASVAPDGTVALR